MNISRPEHPMPNRMRDEWINLNGVWEFEIDNEVSGIEKEYYKRDSLTAAINVPFCPESELSGVNNKDFMNCVWYRRSFSVPEEYLKKRVLIHFGAVDYHATVYINGERIGEHKGGYSSFCFDITANIKKGENIVTVCAIDDTRSGGQPTGKQSAKYGSYNCFYTRTTGIWQTVWLEAVGTTYIESYDVNTDIDNVSAMFRLNVAGETSDKTISAEVFYDGNKVGYASTILRGKSVCINVPLSEKHLWDIGEGNLYDVVFTVKEDGQILDTLKGYFGLRSISMSQKGLMLNGRLIFGRFVLDQGFYPDGIYTAPTDEALKKDIEDAVKLGFNGARLHQKIFEPRFLYWADKLGYLVWEEHANWGLDISKRENLADFLCEWVEAMKRDSSHPCIIGWCPLNETWDVDGNRQDDAIISTVYYVTSALDSTRPVIDTSGLFHTVQYDIFDVHDYEQDAEKLKTYYSELDKNILNDQIERNPLYCGRQHYNGEQVFVSEYGGIKWDESADDSWGYGNAPKTREEFLKRFKDLTEVLMSNKKVFAICYTQLYDVEQECNGLMTYDRKMKFDAEYFRNVLLQKAAIEEQ